MRCQSVLGHSWNGKFGIPSGLVTRDFQQPQTTELLWVYEGLTRYLNWVVAARSGILSSQRLAIIWHCLLRRCGRGMSVIAG